jgi:hypothetical protein
MKPNQPKTETSAPVSSTPLLGDWKDADGKPVTMGENLADGITGYCGLALIHTETEGWHYRIGAYQRQPNK